MDFIVELDGFKPKRATSKSAGYDLRALEDGQVEPNTVVHVATGIRLLLEENTVGLVCSRSGMASKGVFVVNAPGVIDADYDGHVGVLLCNLGKTTFEYKRGDRVAQLLQMTLVPPADKNTLKRGTGGFGSTGV
jgi:dUTP pyrophosphatase